MKKISAEIIADSINEQGDRITSYILTFPRIVLAELNTHRMFSRNSASSRAIPFNKMVEMVKEDPFIPIAWQRDHSGMQGTEYFKEGEEVTAKLNSWLRAKNSAIEESSNLNYLGVTKQLCNRLLEPFMWHTAIVTATEFENFFALRCPQYEHKIGNETHFFRSWKDLIEFIESTGKYTNEYIDLWKNETTLGRLKYNKGQGEIHIMALAEAMWDARNESIPTKLEAGKWHIPFGDKMSKGLIMNLQAGPWSDESIQKAKIKIATARCARVSYLNFEGKDDYEADIKLHDRLSSMGHWSPFEHCARVMSDKEYHNYNGSHYSNKIGNGWSGNFKGFIQYRKTFDKENIT